MALSINEENNSNNRNLSGWFILFLLPIALAINTYLKNETDGIKTYSKCIDERKSYLSQDILGICCVRQSTYDQGVNKDKLFIPFADKIRVLWARTHSISAVLVCLFLTPNLLFLFSFLLPTSKQLFLISSRFAIISVYVFCIFTFIYQLINFKDS